MLGCTSLRSSAADKSASVHLPRLSLSSLTIASLPLSLSLDQPTDGRLVAAPVVIAGAPLLFFYECFVVPGAKAAALIAAGGAVLCALGVLGGAEGGAADAVRSLAAAAALARWVLRGAAVAAVLGALSLREGGGRGDDGGRD